MFRYAVSISLISLAIFALSACGSKATPDPQPAESRTAEQREADARAQAEQETPPDQYETMDESAIPAPADVAGPPDDAEVTSTGLASRVLVAGQGAAHPSATSVVRVHYTGWTTDGKMFDSSVVRNEPISFPLDKVIPGWQEGVMLMVEGETRRLWIPEELAYAGRPGAPQGMLVFDVELIAIEQP